MEAKITNIYDSMGLDSETVALYSDAFQLKSKGGMKIRAADLAPVRVFFLKAKCSLSARARVSIRNNIFTKFIGSLVTGIQSYGSSVETHHEELRSYG